MKATFLGWTASIATFLFVGCTSRTLIAKTDSLENVVRTLPPKYLADCPYADRDRFVADLESDGDTFRWDPANKWMNFCSDSGPVPPTSMIYMRMFKQRNGDEIVFVHMPKPFAAGGSPPAANQTFVLKADPKGEWIDLTHSVLPSKADLTAHYSPSKTEPMIEVAPNERVERADGRGEAYHFGPCTQELWWNGHDFELKDVAPRKLSDQF